LENRLRFPLEVFAAVRAAWPREKPLSATISASDWAKGGSDVEEAVLVAKALKKHGCDLVEVVAGQTTLHSSPSYDRYFLAPYSEQIRHEAGLPTMIGGGLTITDEANSLLAGGRTDLCIMNPPRMAG
jgi:anthraniloyl-CoA monooxygenase